MMAIHMLTKLHGYPRHGTVQVGPDNIQEAGTPINPANLMVLNGQNESYIKDVTFILCHLAMESRTSCQ
ncbi:MAG: hypothetical protein ACLS5G_06060 [Streptococcus sp.]